MITCEWFGVVLLGAILGNAIEVAGTLWHSLVAASFMMGMLGAAVWSALRWLPSRSWRIRSFLAGAVLLNGVMFVRTPIELAWLPGQSAVVSQIEQIDGDAWLPMAIDADPNFVQRTVGSPRGSVGVPFDSIEHTSRITDRWATLWSASNHWMVFLAVLWAGVATVLLTTSLVRYGWLLRLVGRLRSAPGPWQQQWDQIVADRGVGSAARRCQMLVSSGLGPMMVRCPSRYVLVVPDQYWRSLTLAQRRSVLLHELAHLERRDVWRQSLAQLVTLGHWFNPFAWWALRQYELASEVACDARVAEQGRRASAQFASALVQLMQYHADRKVSFNPRGLGHQSMAAPPLNVRVARLLSPNPQGDPLMKRVCFLVLAIVLVAGSLFQVRLTTAQTNENQTNENRSSESGEQPVLRVLTKETDQRLAELASQFDRADTSTERLAKLLETSSGKIAVAGLLDQLRGRARREAQAEAVSRFIDANFDRSENGRLRVKPSASELYRRWRQQSERLAVDIDGMRDAMNEIASRLDTSDEASALFKRLLQDPQAPAAVLLQEMDGGDVIARFLSEALERIIVQRGDGSFTIVPSQRREAEHQIHRFELANQIAARLKKELPQLASEYAQTDEPHRKLVEYLEHPMTAIVTGLQVADDASSPGDAVNQIYEHFESVSRDTADGLVITEPEAWRQLEEIFERVDRAEAMLPRIQPRLIEVADSMTTDDPLAKRLKAQMRQPPLAVLLASELPYAESNAGEQLKRLLDEVIVEKGDRLVIRDERREELGEKARQLLQACRRIRRYQREIEPMLKSIDASEGNVPTGESAQYAMLNEIRRFASQHQPDPVALLRQEVLETTPDQRLRVREDRREVIRDLVQQAERVRQEAANDDF